MKLTLIALAGLLLATTACGGSTPAGSPAADNPSAGAPAADTSGQAALAPGALPGEPATGPEQTLPSGLKIITIKEGTGAQPQTGQTVNVHYSGFLTDGTPFDSSIERGQPLPFELGTPNIIQGWNEGIAQMKTGGKAKLVIPPSLGYRSEGFGSVIPPDATLIFDVELVSVQ